MIPVILSTLCALAAPPLDAITLDGEVVSGQLVAATSDALTVDSDGGPQTLPLARLQKINFTEPAAASGATPAAWVELVDGSAVRASSYVVDGKSAEIQLLGGGSGAVPIRAIRAVRFKQQDEDQQLEWNRIRQERTQADRLVIRKNDRVDYLEGALHNINAETVNFQLGDEVIPVGLAKIEGIIYHHRGIEDQPPAVFRLTDVEGSVLEGTQWTVADQGLSVRTPVGLEIRRSFDQIRQVDFSSDKIIYLAALEPKSTQWMPYFASGGMDELLKSFYLPKNDRALTGNESEADEGRLQLAFNDGGEARIEAYARGIAVHSQTTIVYELPEKASRLRATVGIDARVRDSGHVRLVIKGDGQELFADDVDGADDPRELSINVTGVRQLEIFVDFGENQDVGDHLNLCNARIVK